MQDVLKFWFDDGTQWRSQLWWGGKDTQNRRSHEETIAYMKTTFGKMIEDKSWREWEECGYDGKLAVIILLDQIGRMINGEEVFTYDFTVSSIANSILDTVGTSVDSVPWKQLTFVNIALSNSESIENVRRAIFGFTAIINHYGGVGSAVGTRINKCFKEAVRRVRILERYKRDPLRNAFLSRISTKAESRYIANVEAKKSQTPKATAPAPDNRTGLIRVLVLHGLRQNSRKFSKMTKKVLDGISKETKLEFVFLDAPHRSSLDNAANVTMLANTGRHWYNATTDENGNTIYEGLDESIEYLDECFDKRGPFQCVIGFSQGACVASVMASLHASGSEKAKHFNPNCYICISGGECRDSRTRFKSLHEENTLDIPSFHIYGETDTIMPPDRTIRLSQVYKDAVVKGHPGDHFKNAIEKWPIDDVADWLDSLNIGSSSAVVENPYQIDGPSIPDFHSKLTLTLKETTDDLFPLAPKGLCNPQLLKSSFWERCVAGGRSTALNPHAASFQQSDVSQFVSEMIQNSTNIKELVSDLLLLSWCIYENVNTKRMSCPFQKKASNAEITAIQEHANQITYWLWWSILKEESVSEFRGEVLNNILNSLSLRGAWEDIERVCLLACTGVSKKVNIATNEVGCACEIVPDDKHESQLADPIVSQLLHASAQFIADRLHEDYKKCTTTSTTERPSDCVKHVVKTRRSYTAKKTDLVKLTSDKLVRNIEQISPAKATYDRVKKFAEVVKGIKDVLDTKYNLDYHNLKKSLIYSNWKETIIDQERTDAEYQKLVTDLPLSNLVIHPEPEPVDIATSSQMQPVLDYIKNSEKMKKTNDFIAFTKGTMCGDGRLDLCKQVIGPKGIDPLLDSLRNDTDQKVRHLLLGNNIAGDELGPGVADMVTKKSSHISTWYIAGNHLTDVGIKPVCLALETDDYVNQLWLKRNPLKPSSAHHLSKMLTLNQHLKVLDLTCTGLLDEGTITLMGGLSTNKTLEVLYLNGNGITCKSIPSICDMLKKDTALTSLGLGCNRIGDEGAKMIFAVNELKLDMLDLSSAGIGPKGATYIAEFLKVNKTLRKLDLGFLLMTVAIGELCNRIGNSGAEAIAESLKSNNTLQSLSLRHNGIAETGQNALRSVLCGSLDSTSHRNATIIELVYEQYGLPVSRINREGIRAALGQNFGLLTKEQRKSVHVLLNPPHLQEVLSVYRLGGKYPTL
eukprot:TRINITY_DN6575_c1_g1_i1.p1 TRINITY_DN6575_c1_g1~~TRINITY_DN6575_c1_g1_i1.p1  ORF type:complete len:1200 (+),score=193.21 TRINITY_DN6575_c1_g1_i1:51-3650(+)